MVSPSGTVSSVRGTSAHRGNGRSGPMPAPGQRLSLLGQFSGSRPTPRRATPTRPPAARSRAQRELARPGAEAELDERVLPLRADDGLAVDALDAQPLDAPAVDGVGERGGGVAEPRVVRLDEHLEPLAAALDVEHGLGAGEHDVGAGMAGGG